MAQLYRGENPNQQKQWNYLFAAIMVFLPLGLYMYLFITGKFALHGYQHFLPMLLFGFPAAYLYSMFGRLSSGVRGETVAINELITLSDEYLVFSNVHLHNGKFISEMDAIVIGPNGVFVVEVKGHNGVIEGSSEQDTWTQHKVGRRGGEYSKTMKNPIKQLKRNIYDLSQYLKQQGINVWIDGVIAFTAAEELKVSSPAVPVITVPYLLPLISSHKPRRLLSAEDVQKVAATIQRLNESGVQCA